MTDEEWKRWKNFSMRMAWRGFDRLPKKSKRRIAAGVKDFFRMLQRDYFDGTDHLVKAEYDPLMKCVMKWGEQDEFLMSRIVNWDNTESHPIWRNQYGHCSNGPYICDIVSEWLDSIAEGDIYDGDRCYREWMARWGNRISCSIRAGMDVAVAPSGGVMGFTAGDLRRMYRSHVPDWVMGTEPLEVQHFTGVIPGIGLVPGKCETNGTFADLPDDAELWL